MSGLILPPGYSNWGAHSRPQPNPEVEGKIRSWLKESFDPLLDIKWFEDIVFEPRHQQMEGRYALVCKWPQADKRYSMIQSGEIGDSPYDILGWFTEDMQEGGTRAISPDMFEARVVELLGKADNTRVPWKERMARSALKNLERKKKIKQDFLDQQIHDLASHYRNEGLGIHQVNVPVEITNNASSPDERKTHATDSAS